MRRKEFDSFINLIMRHKEQRGIPAERSVSSKPVLFGSKNIHLEEKWHFLDFNAKLKSNMLRIMRLLRPLMRKTIIKDTATCTFAVIFVLRSAGLSSLARPRRQER